MDAQTLQSLAEAHCAGFAAVGANSANKTIDEIASEYASFLSPTSLASYSQFGCMTYTSRSAGVSNMRAWLASLERVGISPQTGIAIKDQRVEVFAKHVAFCRFTNVFTPNQGEPFEFEVFMVYRVPIGETSGSWDLNMGDAQMDAILERYPKFSETEAAPIEITGSRTV